MIKNLGEHRWLIFVLPGFIALFVAGFISDFPRIRDVQLPIVYVALTFLSVSIPLFIAQVYGRLLKKEYNINNLLRAPRFVAGVFLCSFVIGFIFGIAHTTDYISRALRNVFGNDIVLISSHSELIRVLFKNAYNEKFLDGQPNVGRDLKRRKNRYARFSFSDDRKDYEGVIASFFSGEEKPQVYLSPACKISKNGVSIVKGPGVWLNLERVEDIQFIYSVCSECASALEVAAGKKPSTNCPFP